MEGALGQFVEADGLWKFIEEQRVAGAIKTDFILSAEIMTIALATIDSTDFWTRAAVLVVVAVAMTVLVYGAVALLVKMDDFGLRLAETGQVIQLRLAIIPGINDDNANLHATAEFAASLPTLAGISILPFHKTAQEKYANLGLPYPMAAVQPPDQTRLRQITALMRSYGLPVSDH